MKLFRHVLLQMIGATLISQVPATHAADDVRLPSDKYDPPQTLIYACKTTVSQVDDDLAFVISFTRLDYVGGEGGFFYDGLTRTDQRDNAQNVSGVVSAFTNGELIFNDGMQILLKGNQPIDGTTANTLYLAKRLDFQTNYRSGGTCTQISN
jgi:hypothetical protein